MFSASEITYIVSSGALNSTHSLSLCMQIGECETCQQNKIYSTNIELVLELRLGSWLDLVFN